MSARTRNKSTGRWQPVAPEVRFWPNVNRDGPAPSHCPELGACWLWTGCLGAGGYGAFIMGRDQYAHRASWIFANGAIPDNLCVLHKCDTPACVNPAHLFLGTTKDNIEDRQRKGRQASGDRTTYRLYPELRLFGDLNGSRTHPESRPRGEQHWKASITEDDVLQIRAEHAAGKSTPQIGKERGISRTHIRRIVLGISWAHVGKEPKE